MLRPWLGLILSIRGIFSRSSSRSSSEKVIVRPRGSPWYTFDVSPYQTMTVDSVQLRLPSVSLFSSPKPNERSSTIDIVPQIIEATVRKTRVFWFLRS